MNMLGSGKTVSLTLLTVLVSSLAVQSAEQIDADWLRQEQVRQAGAAPADGPVTPEQDAVGACDGIKDGTWGFHTGREKDPWWQIDLGEVRPVERIVVFNRCDLADRALRLAVLLSCDGQTFRKIYQHDGAPFFGHTDGKPLIITLGGEPARYVRLRQPGTDYLHLDEVEIYAPNAEANIALGKNATQSSTSQWSKRHSSKTGFDVGQIVARGLKLAESLRG